MPETIVRISAQEAADRMNVGVSYVYALIQMSRIRHFWTRGRVYIIPEKNGTVEVSPQGHSR